MHKKLGTMQEYTMPMNADKILETPYQSLLSVDYNIQMLATRLGIHFPCENSDEVEKHVHAMCNGGEPGASGDKARMNLRRISERDV